MTTVLTTRVLPKQAKEVHRELRLIHDRLANDPELNLGDHGSAITALQQQLKSAGLYHGKTTGTYDADTANAVTKLQAAKGLNPTGTVDRDTFQKVQSLNLFVKSDDFKPWAHLNQRGADIRSVEAQLHRLGRDGVKVDGIFDQDTARAVRAFQKKHGLKATGAINGATADKIDFAVWMKQAKTVKGYVQGDPRTIKVLPVGDGEWMRVDAAIAFKKMQAAAKKAGVSLPAVSGWRSMADQRRLYAMWKAGTGNLAARPGYSNHQGGIAMDIGDIGGYNTRDYHWLANNAKRFGFVNDVGGEYWHWTYKR